MGHCASACLLVDGRIEAMVSEERFTRKKNQSGFPAEAVGWIARTYSVDGSNLDAVAVAERLAQVEELKWHGDAWEGLASAVTRLEPTLTTIRWACLTTECISVLPAAGRAPPRRRCGP